MNLNKRHGLGKGLGALIPDSNDSGEDGRTSQSVNKIHINLIKANSNQPRKNFDTEKISQLAESIKEHGVIQPILLKKEDKSYVVIAGERRWRACKLIGLKEIPAVVMEDIDEKKVLELSLIENIQREDLNPIEEALAYERLLNDFLLTQEALSKRIGKSRTAITNTLRLLNLDRRVQEYLIDGVISEGHGRALLGINDKQLQYELAQKIIDESLSVREVERNIKVLGKNNKKYKNSPNEMSPYVDDIKNKLQEYLGTKVLISSKKNKGKIEIEYYSEEDLQRIIDILKV